jgi:hypothetical protein
VSDSSAAIANEMKSTEDPQSSTLGFAEIIAIVL